MKRSIAYKVTGRVSLICLLALAILFVASFLLVQNIISDKTEKYAEATLSAYSDLICKEIQEAGLPIRTENAEIFLEIGNDICRWYDVDFAYLFYPLEDTGNIRYICVSQNERFDEINPTDRYVGKVTEYTLTDEEWAVWHGERAASHSITESKSGHEISTMLRVQDAEGNYIMAGVDISYEEMRGEIIRLFAILALIIILVIIGINALVFFVIRRQVSRPAALLSQKMTDFIADGKRADIKLNEKGSDEYAMIAASFNAMAQNIDTYLADIGKLSREQERQQTEMDIASEIQKGFLPMEHLDSEFFEVRSSMQPAKDVGGDFYSYLPLDDRRVVTVIADVSGKGVSAALMMAVTMTLTVQYAKMGLSPAEILEKTNEALQQNNPAMLFATEFVGIFDSESGTYTYANAGHNPPYIITENGVTALTGAAGTLVGIYEGETYTENSVHLDVGDTVFLYTDGVTEATDAENRFFGETRLEETLRNFRNSHAYNPIAYVREVLKTHAGGSDPHDDITMLTLTVKKTAHLSLDVNVNELEKIKELILSQNLPREKQLQLCLCAEEWFVNICAYAFPDGVPAGEKIDFSLIFSDRITMVFSDGGMPFNPLEHILDIADYDMDSQVGGLGNFITVSSTDDIFYERKNNKNILTMIKF